VPVDRHAAGAGLVQATDDVEQGGLAAAARAHQHHKRAAGDLHRHAAQRLDPAPVDLEGALDLVDIDHRGLLRRSQPRLPPPAFLGVSSAWYRLR